MTKLLVLFSIFLFFIAIFLLLIYKKKNSRIIKTKNFSSLITSPKELANNPDINTNNWYLHKNRLIKFGRSQYKGLTFFVSSDDKIYYISEEGIKVYC
ncbi:possible Cytochrome b(C-terminal)/b6/petD [Prochlorococcus marinus str. MIT 9515]|uniref:Possible Cytochrome b(C-terminal)/b6/petD n=1 Tax=Prochlorococcus marinus (strain MIT 9515) TaxID=167542 RepID=A2BXJ2_PROM5|nr:hypothetical protein [Prochlorococcus marinus]ABM72503.1 possible Cytochrome b(C-terminal)/b6/petD [Prochlorococcus marinus str. MIT 9515]